MTPGAINFPTLEQLPEIQRKIYVWYHEHGDARHAASVYAEALG